MKNDKKTVGAAYMIWLLLGVTFLLVGLSQKNRTFIVLGFSNIILGFTCTRQRKKVILVKRIKRMTKNLKLKMARVEHDLTQGDLADAIGVTRQTIGLIEAGKYNPSLGLCIAICKRLGKTLDQLFWEEES